MRFVLPLCIYPVLAFHFFLFSGCGVSETNSSQQKSTMPSGQANLEVVERKNDHVAEEKSRKRDATLAYWNGLINITEQVNQQMLSLEEGASREPYPILVKHFSQLPVINVDEELVNFINSCMYDFLVLAAANKEVARLNADIGFLSYLSNEFTHSLATGRPGTYYREYNKGAQEMRDKMSIITKRLQEKYSELLNIRGDLTRRYEIEFPAYDGFRGPFCAESP